MMALKAAGPELFRFNGFGIEPGEWLYTGSGSIYPQRMGYET